MLNLDLSLQSTRVILMPRITLLLFSLIITLAAFAFQNTTTQAAPPTPNQLAWESYGPYGGQYP